MKRIPSYLLVIGLVSGLLGACTPGLGGLERPDGSEPETPEPETPEPETPEPETPEPETPEPETPELDVTGTYELTSRFDLTAGSVLPDPVYTYVGVLADLRDDPAATLFELLESAGVPLLEEIMDALPAALESRLHDWINDYVASTVFRDGPVTDAIDTMLMYTETVLASFDLISELDVPAHGEQLQSTHRLRALGMRVDGLDLEIPVELGSEIPSAVLEAPVALSATPRDETSADLSLGAHSFGLAYGAYALEALEQVAHERYGMGIREALGAMIDCPALAASVADRCVWGVCVGHEQELTELCEEGLDLAMDELRARMHELRFDAVELSSGAAVITSEPGASETRIANGVWQARINAGQGLRPAPATFAGVLLP